MSRSTIPGRFLRTQVDVETFLGESAYGPRYAASKKVRVVVSEVTRLVRAPSGDEVTSGTTLYAHPTDQTAFAAGSRITIEGDRTATVIDVKPHRGRTGAKALVEVVCS